MSSCDGTIMMRSGTHFNFLDPSKSVFTINDIAHALSNACRFAGHCVEHYSVAQHSVMVSKIVPPEHAFAGLMHDAAEFVLGDVAKPLKLLLPDYQRIEKIVEAEIFARFGLPPRLPAAVKLADMVMLATEQRDLMFRVDPWKCIEGVTPLAKKIVPFTARAARAIFLERFYELQSEAA